MAELRAVGRNTQERHQIGPLTASLESLVHVRHKDLVVGDEMIRRQEGHQIVGGRLGNPEQRVEHGGGGASFSGWTTTVDSRMSASKGR
jgi:hypothetical protein